MSDALQPAIVQLTNEPFLFPILLPAFLLLLPCLVCVCVRARLPFNSPTPPPLPDDCECLRKPSDGVGGSPLFPIGGLHCCYSRAKIPRADENSAKLLAPNINNKRTRRCARCALIKTRMDVVVLFFLCVCLI